MKKFPDKTKTEEPSTQKLPPEFLLPVLSRTRSNNHHACSALVNNRYGDAKSSRKRTLRKRQSFPLRKNSVSLVSQRTTCSANARRLGNELNLSANVRTMSSCIVQAPFFFLERKKTSLVPEKLGRKNQRRAVLRPVRRSSPGY